MSRGTEVFDLARTAYLRLIPHLRGGGAVFAGVTLAAILLGPEGALAGAAFGTALHLSRSEWASAALAGFTMLLQFVENNPYAVGIITTVIGLLRQFITVGGNELPSN